MTFNKQEFNRTAFIVREMSESKILELPDGFTVRMGEDMPIGYRIPTKMMIHNRGIVNTQPM